MKVHRGRRERLIEYLIVLIVFVATVGVALICKMFTPAEIDQELSMVFPNSPLRDPAIEQTIADAANKGVDPRAVLGLAMQETQAATDGSRCLPGNNAFNLMQKVRDPVTGQYVVPVQYECQTFPGGFAQNVNAALTTLQHRISDGKTDLGDIYIKPPMAFCDISKDPNCEAALQTLLGRVANDMSGDTHDIRSCCGVCGNGKQECDEECDGSVAPMCGNAGCGSDCKCNFGILGVVPSSPVFDDNQGHPFTIYWTGHPKFPVQAYLLPDPGYPYQFTQTFTNEANPLVWEGAQSCIPFPNTTCSQSYNFTSTFYLVDANGVNTNAAVQQWLCGCVPDQNHCCLDYGCCFGGGTSLCCEDVPANNPPGCLPSNYQCAANFTAPCFGTNYQCSAPECQSIAQ